MKVLSIRQPWAWCVIHARKDVENRDWYSHYRGELLIHTGKTIDRQGFDAIKSIMGHVSIGDVLTNPNPIIKTGGIIGKVNMIDCVRNHDSKWFFGEYGFVFENPVPVPFIPLKGQLGMFNYEY